MFAFPNLLASVTMQIPEPFSVDTQFFLRLFLALSLSFQPCYIFTISPNRSSVGCGASSAKPGAVASPAAAKKDAGKPKPVAGANLPPTIVKKIPEKPVKPAVPRPDDEPDWDVEEYALGYWEDEMVPCQIVKCLGDNWYMVHFIGDEDDDLEKLHDDDLIDIPAYEVGDWMWGHWEGEWEGCVVVGVVR
jgi:hypothetical protein